MSVCFIKNKQNVCAYFILTKVKVKSINYVSLPNRYSNKLRGNATRLGAVYVCDDAHDEIVQTFSLRLELYYDEFIV